MLGLKRYFKNAIISKTELPKVLVVQLQKRAKRKVRWLLIC